MTRTTATFSMEVGRFVVRQVEMRLRQAAHGVVDIDIERAMSLLSGVLLVTVKGDKERVQAYLRAVQEWKP